MSAEVVRDESGSDLDAVAMAAESYADWSPGIRTNMVMSVDGSVSFRGRVGTLSSATDRTLFHALRALSDVVLVGAATARVENYGPVVLTERLTSLRAGAQLPWAAAQPRLAIVTASCQLPQRCLDLPASQRPFVITSARARTDAVADHADVIVAGADDVDLPAAITQLRERGFGRVLCEGGPTLIDWLAAADLVDELCVTLTPQLTAEALPSAHPGLAAASPLAAPRRFRLRHAIAHDDELFLRYMRQ